MVLKTLNLEIIKSPTTTTEMPIKMYFIPIAAISLCSQDLSIEKRITASTIFAVKIGYSNATVDTTKSYVPYSVVDNTLVYKGTNKNTKIFEAKLLIVSTPIFFIK